MTARRLNAFEEAWGRVGEIAAVNAAGVVRVRGPLTPAILRCGLDALQRRHEVLRAAVRRAGDGHELVVVDAPPIPLRVLERTGGDQIERLLELETDTPFPQAAAPLVRVTLVAPGPGEPSGGVTELLITFHHVIIDMISAFTLYRELLTSCQDLAAGGSGALDGTVGLPHVPETSLPLQLRGRAGQLTYARYLVSSVLPAKLRRVRLLAPQAAVPVEARHTRSLSRRLAPARLARLERQARQERASVHGAVVAALLVASARTLGEPRITLNVDTLSNARGLLEPAIPSAQPGCFASYIGSWHTVGPCSSFWDLAREVTEQVGRGVFAGKGFLRARLMRSLVPRGLAMGKYVHKALGCSTSGRVRIPWSYGPFEIVDLDGVVSIHAMGSSCVAFSMQGPAGLALRFVYSEPDQERAAMETFVETAMDALERSLTVTSSAPAPSGVPPT